MDNGLNDLCRRYLDRRAFAGPWRIAGSKRDGCRGAVVIPACDEEHWLFRTLESLAANRPELLASFLVLVVVNHPPDAEQRVKTANRRTLEQLAAAPLRRKLDYCWVDACSEGCQLPTGGVGAARKLGFDLALSRLRLDIDPLLVSLDADTLVEADYLDAVTAHFESTPAGGTVIPYAHQAGGDAAAQRAIDTYELYLRCYVLGLSLAGSPYAFHTIGSAMACRGSAYLRCGGMNRRKGGEDFYFLQALAKTAGVAHLYGTTVYPSARLSTRVPFGTGPSLVRLVGNPDEKLFYPLPAFVELGRWLELAAGATATSGGELQTAAAALCGETGQFLQERELAGSWDRLRANHRRPERLLQAFHGWFDGLKSQQLLRHLVRSGRYSMITAGEAVRSFFPRIGLTPGNDLPRSLARLRQRQSSPPERSK